MDFLKTRHPFIQFLLLAGLLGFGILVGGALSFMILKPLTGLNPLEMSGASLKDPQTTNAWRILFAINSIGVFLVPGLLFAKFYDHPAMDKIGFRSASVRNLLIAVALISISLPLINSISILNKGIHFPESMKKLEETFRAMTKQYEEQVNYIISMPNMGVLFMNLIVMAVLPAIAEELFFRGCMQQIFQQWFRNMWVAVIVSAVLFSAFHFDFYGFFPRVILGIILGWLFAKTGSLLPGILAHFFNNGIALVFTYVGQHASVQKNYATQDLDIPMWTGLVSLLFVIYLLSLLQRDHNFDYSQPEDHSFKIM